MADVEVAVLALQGDFERHIVAFERLGVRAIAARTERAILDASHLVLPGGESTTLLKLLALDRLDSVIEKFHRSGRPMFATCAGVILAAREVRSPAQRSLGLLDVVVERNAYGRQLDSFATPIACDAIGDQEFAAVFIRAPIIREVGSTVEVLASRGTPVLVRQRTVLAATFHPELTDDNRVHELFIAMG